MRDLVFVKFNSKLRQKRDDKSRDPIEMAVADVVEDEDNEGITCIVQKENANEGEELEGAKGGSSQGGTSTTTLSQNKRKRGNQNLRNRKRKKMIPIPDEEPSATSSSEGEDDNAIDMASPSNSSSDEHSISFNSD